MLHSFRSSFVGYAINIVSDFWFIVLCLTIKKYQFTVIDMVGFGTLFYVIANVYL